MKLLHFASWQSIDSKIPIASPDKDQPLIMVYQPRNFTQSTKGGNEGRSSSWNKKHEIHRFKTGTKIDKSELIPTMVLTTRYHLSVLGRRRKDIYKYDDGDAPLIEIPEWIYTCKPTPSTAFISSTSSSNSTTSQEGRMEHQQDYYRISPLASIIDPQKRFVYATQAQNHILSAWSLDKDVGGPDIDDDKYIQKYKFDSPMVSLHLLPERRKVKIRCGIDKNANNNNSSTVTSFVEVTGGVTGLLATGDMFIAFHTTSSDTVTGDNSKLIVGVLKESDVSTSQSVAMKGNHQLLLSMVGYTSTSSSTMTEIESIHTHEKSRKRKSPEMDEEIDVSGDIVIYALSRVQSTNSVVLSRHSIEMSSLLLCTLQNDDTRNPFKTSPKNRTSCFNISGNYLIRSNLLSIAHNNIQHIFATQLDATHVSLVYNPSTSTSTKGGPWLCSWFDIRQGNLSPHPFQISDPSTDTGHVIKVAGISSALISILSNEGIVRICDVRRAAIVYAIQLQSLPGYDPHYDVSHLDLSSEWHTGSLCIIMQPKLGGQTNMYHPKVYISQIRLQDSNENSSSDATHRTLKGSYNLASILASCIMTSKALNKPALVETSQLTATRDINSILPTLSSKTKTAHIKNSLKHEFQQSLHNLESFRLVGNKNRRKSDTFSNAYRQIIERFTTLESEEKLQASPKQQSIILQNGHNGTHHAKDQNKISIGDTSRMSIADISNTAASVAIDIILSFDVDDAYLLETVQTLFDIIETGEVSARRAFVSKKFNDRTLSLLLLKLHQKSVSKKLILQLICRILSHCPDSLPEYMLVSLVHYILCHLTTTQLVESFDHIKTLNLGMRVHGLFRRFKLSQDSKDGVNGKSSEHNSKALKDRLGLNLKISLIDAVVSYSHCNATLLRVALQRDLQNSTKGEVEALFHILANLLRKESDAHVDLQRRKSRLISLINWIAALVDSHLVIFASPTSSEAGSSLPPLAGEVRKAISLMINHGEILASLDDILIYFDPACKRNRSKSCIDSILLNARQVSTPDYSIEPLIF